MAVKNITITKVPLNEGTTVSPAAATTAADGFTIEFTGQDERMFILFQNSGASEATVQITKGNGIQGAVDLAALSIAASGLAVFRLDSGCFLNVSGDNKGKVVAIPSSTDIKCAVVQLP